jgi:hypothetical protein
MNSPPANSDITFNAYIQKYEIYWSQSILLKLLDTPDMPDYFSRIMINNFLQNLHLTGLS